MSTEIQFVNPSSEIDPTIESQQEFARLTKSESKRKKALLSGTTHPASQLQPMSQTIPAKVKKRKSKNETGIWMVEKSLDKKHWIASTWEPTRQRAKVASNKAQADPSNRLSGLWFRVTRYEPVR